MKKRKRIIINGYMKRIGIGILVSLIIVVAICLIKSNYRNIETLSNVLVYVGAIEMTVGFLSLIGNMKFRGNANYQITRTAGAESSQKRIHEDINGTEKSFKFMIYMSIVGVVMIGLSNLVQYVR